MQKNHVFQYLPNIKIDVSGSESKLKGSVTDGYDLHIDPARRNNCSYPEQPVGAPRDIECLPF